MNDPIAVRKLRWIGADEHDVMIRLWSPELIGHGPAGSPGHEMRCKFSIDGLPQPVEAGASGVDSLQALIVALTGIRCALLPYRDSLSWFEEDGEFGVPLMITMFDRQEARYLEKMVEHEIEHFLEIAARPHSRRLATWMKEYGVEPIVRPRQFSDDAVVKMLLNAVSKERAFERDEDFTGAYVFAERRRALLTILRTRQDHEKIVARLLASEALTAVELGIPEVPPT